MAKFDSKSFNAEAFGKYVQRVPNVKRDQLAKSGAVGSNENARNALSTQTGSLYARIPYFGRISGDTSQNNDGNTNITSTSTTTFEQGFITASRMDSWTERSFSKNITAGVDFMDNIAAQLSDYKLEVKQAMLKNILAGIFSMKTDGGTVPEKAAKEFIEKHTYDVTLLPGEAAYVGAASLNKAIQRACGDNKNIFTLVVMHSEVATRLENLKLMKFLTQTDKDGIERELTFGTWNGRLVLIDDDMPTEEVTGGYIKVPAGTEGALKVVSEAAADNEIATESVTPTVDEGYSPAEGDYVIKVDDFTAYTSYLLGNGSIVLDDIGDSVPYEMSRDPKTNGGQDTLYVRDRYICGVDGISFEKPVTITASASNDDLKNGENWNIINDGKTAIPHKAIAIARLITKG